MKVGQLMTTEVQFCKPTDRLSKAAAIMWQNDCGCVPVVDAKSAVVGMITDRDICMATWMQGRAIDDIPISMPMSQKVWTCRDTDTVDTAERTMRDHRVRRLPVVDKQNHLVGILSLNDIVREAGKQKGAAAAALTDKDIRQTLAAVCEHRPD